MNIYLGEHFETFIREQIASGRYTNASEVVRDGMRLLEDREARMDEIRRGIDAGRAEIASGNFVVVEDVDEFFDDLERKIASKGTGDLPDDTSLPIGAERHVAEEAPEYR